MRLRAHAAVFGAFLAAAGCRGTYSIPARAAESISHHERDLEDPALDILRREVIACEAQLNWERLPWNLDQLPCECEMRLVAEDSPETAGLLHAPLVTRYVLSCDDARRQQCSGSASDLLFALGDDRLRPTVAPHFAQFARELVSFVGSARNTIARVDLVVAGSVDCVRPSDQSAFDCFATAGNSLAQPLAYRPLFYQQSLRIAPAAVDDPPFEKNAQLAFCRATSAAETIRGAIHGSPTIDVPISLRAGGFNVAHFLERGVVPSAASHPRRAGESEASRRIDVLVSVRWAPAAPGALEPCADQSAAGWLACLERCRGRLAVSSNPGVIARVPSNPIFYPRRGFVCSPTIDVDGQAVGERDGACDGDFAILGNVLLEAQPPAGGPVGCGW